MLEFLLPRPMKQESTEMRKWKDITTLKAASHSEMPNFGSDVDGFTVNKTTQDICNSQNNNKKIWQLWLPMNMTNSDKNLFFSSTWVGNKVRETRHHVLAVAALAKSLSMFWWCWHISISQLCCCWSMAVSFWYLLLSACGLVCSHENVRARIRAVNGH